VPGPTAALKVLGSHASRMPMLTVSVCATVTAEKHEWDAHNHRKDRGESSQSVSSHEFLLADSVLIGQKNPLRFLRSSVHTLVIELSGSAFSSSNRRAAVQNLGYEPESCHKIVNSLHFQRLCLPQPKPVQQLQWDGLKARGDSDRRRVPASRICGNGCRSARRPHAMLRAGRYAPAWEQARVDGKFI